MAGLQVGLATERVFDPFGRCLVRDLVDRGADTRQVAHAAGGYGICNHALADLLATALTRRSAVPRIRACRRPSPASPAAMASSTLLMPCRWCRHSTAKRTRHSGAVGRGHAMSLKPVLVRVAAGEPSAVHDCVLGYGALVWSIAHRYLRNRADAEEVVQEVFLDICSPTPRRGTG